MGNYFGTIYSKIANWKEPVCSLHQKELKFYCNICKTPICEICTETDHKKAEGKHEPIRAFDAFNDFKATANSLMVQADFHKEKAQVEISKYIANVSEFNYARNYIKKDINDTVEEIVRLVRESGTALERKLGDICEAKVCNSHLDELKSNITDVEEKIDCIKRLLTCGEATALLTCHQAIQELRQKIDVFPERQPRGDVKAYFYSKKDDILSSLKKQGIGSVSKNPNENIFEIVSENPIIVTCHQHFQVEIIQKYECEMELKDLTVSTKKIAPSMKDASLTTRIIESRGKYFVEGSSNSDLSLDVKFCNSSIKGSPIKIIVKPTGIVKSIKNVGHSMGITGDNHKGIQDLVMFENGCFLVLCENGIFKFKNSGAFFSRIIPPDTTIQIHKIYKFKNLLCAVLTKNVENDKSKKAESIIFSWSEDDKENKSIISIGDIRNHFPSGIDMDEVLQLLYVVDKPQNFVQVYRYKGKYSLRKIGFKGELEGELNGPSDVAVTKEGNLIVADTENHRLQLLSKDGKFIKVVIGGGTEDGMVIRPSIVDVDKDDNIIVASEGKLQLFDKHGKFIHVIYQIDKEQHKKFVFSIFSYSPRRLALAEVNSTTIHLINF